MSAADLVRIRREILILQQRLCESQREYMEQMQTVSDQAVRLVPPQSSSHRARVGEKGGTDKPRTRKTNNRSGRSTRTNDRGNLATPATTGHPLGIWVVSAALFAPLPSEGELIEIMQTDVPRSDDVRQNQVHWTEKMVHVVRATRRCEKKEIISPPAPSSSAKNSAYWVNRVPPFQLEDVQRQNGGSMYSLLNALVVTAPEQKREGDDDDDAPARPLLPQIETDEYLQHPFGDRLEFELRSAGLDKPEQAVVGETGAFAREVEQFQHEIENIQKMIDKSGAVLCERLPSMHEHEERRFNDENNFLEIRRRVKMEQKRSHKKQS